MARTSVLICHHDEPLNRFGLPRWLASFTDLAAIIIIREPGQRMRKRIRKEIERIGYWRFLDVIAFRIYYRVFLAAADGRAEADLLAKIESEYPPIREATTILETSGPNSPEVERLLQGLKPDLLIARCKTILAKRIFTIPACGTFVMHPGICPEYRNAHGCFWALARRDLANVGMTLLKIDAGVDTGPVYGYFRCDYDECAESHNVIQDRTVFGNLAGLRKRFEEIFDSTAAPLETTGRPSRAWGQPWLSEYLKWKRLAKRSPSHERAEAGKKESVA
jgi:hypothetical protein